MEIYIAGPLFNEHERKFLEEVDSICREEGFQTFLPHRDVEAPYLGDERSSSEVRESIFNQDVAGLEASGLMVALLDGQDVDSGTAWEIGYAYKLGKSIIGITTDFIRRAYSNIMPFVACEKVCYSLEELREYLRKVR